VRVVVLLYTYINHNKWPQRGREIRLTVLHICHRPRIPFGNVLIERRCTQKHCKRSRVQQRKTNPPQTTKRYRVKKYKTKYITKRVRILWWDETRVFSYMYSKTQQRKTWSRRGGKSTLTALHNCHRPRIPFGHVVIEHRRPIKHCKRECNKERKRNPPQTIKKCHTYTKKTKKTTESVWELWSDETRVAVHQGVATERGRERVHLLWFIFVTTRVFHFDTSWLNADADWNTARRGRVQQRKETPNPPHKKQHGPVEIVVR
jgi:hypothetical protein